MKDKDSHCLKKPISGSHLVWFYESKIYKVDQSTVTNANNFVSVEESCGSCDPIQESEMSFEFDDSCKCTNIYHSTPKESLPLTSSPIKLQIVIMPSKDFR